MCHSTIGNYITYSVEEGEIKINMHDLGRIAGNVARMGAKRNTYRILVLRFCFYCFEKEVKFKEILSVLI
jgi:hypothetical protein